MLIRCSKRRAWRRLDSYNGRWRMQPRVPGCHCHVYSIDICISEGCRAVSLSVFLSLVCCQQPVFHHRKIEVRTLTWYAAANRLKSSSATLCDFTNLLGKHKAASSTPRHEKSHVTRVTQYLCYWSDRSNRCVRTNTQINSHLVSLGWSSFFFSFSKLLILYLHNRIWSGMTYWNWFD